MNEFKGVRAELSGGFDPARDEAIEKMLDQAVNESPFTLAAIHTTDEARFENVIRPLRWQLQQERERNSRLVLELKTIKETLSAVRKV